MRGMTKKMKIIYSKYAIDLCGKKYPVWEDGVTVWNNGDIDIAPEYLYKNGVPVADAAGK